MAYQGDLWRWREEEARIASHVKGKAFVVGEERMVVEVGYLGVLESN